MHVWNEKWRNVLKNARRQLQMLPGTDSSSRSQTAQRNKKATVPAVPLSFHRPTPISALTAFSN